MDRAMRVSTLCSKNTAARKSAVLQGGLLKGGLLKSRLLKGATLPLWASLCILPMAAHADETYVFTRAESFSYSGANPVTAYLDLLVGPPPESGKHAFTRNNIELGFGYKNFEFSLIHRNDQNIDFSKDASTFAYLNKNRSGDIPLDVSYDVDVWAEAYQASGFKLAHTWQLNESLRLRAAYSYLIGTETISGYLGKDPNGEGGVIGFTIDDPGGVTRRVLDGDLYTDYYYTDDPFFDREVDEPTSRGFAVDIGFEWKINPQWQVSAQLDDLVAELHWKNVPRTIATATSSNFLVDADGSVDLAPNFSGVNTWGDYVQKLTRRERLLVNHFRGPHSWSYGLDHYKVKSFHRFSYGYRRKSGWGGQFSIEATTAAVEMSLLMPVGYLSITTDDLRVDNARTLGFSWGFTYKL